MVTSTNYIFLDLSASTAAQKNIQSAKKNYKLIQHEIYITEKTKKPYQLHPWSQKLHSFKLRNTHTCTRTYTHLLKRKWKKKRSYAPAFKYNENACAVGSPWWHHGWGRRRGLAAYSGQTHHSGKPGVQAGELSCGDARRGQVTPQLRVVRWWLVDLRHELVSVTTLFLTLYTKESEVWRKGLFVTLMEK